MHRSTERITVTTTANGIIAIAQGEAEDTDQIVHVSPDQVEVLVEWLREACQEPRPES
jgi:hypothetical protein